MLVGVLGIKSSGKDTTADYMCTNYNFNKLILAQPLKDACKVLFNFSDEQLYGNLKETIDPYWKTSPRIVLQYLGTDIFRRDINKIMPNISGNFWVDLMISKYTEMKNKDKNVLCVVSDVRFQNEIDKIHEQGGIVIKLIRPSLSNTDMHESEKNIETLDADYTIINDSTKDNLYMKIDNIIDNIVQEKLCLNLDILNITV